VRYCCFSWCGFSAVAEDGEADGAAVGGDPCLRLGNSSCVCRENDEDPELKLRIDSR